MHQVSYLGKTISSEKFIPIPDDVAEAFKRNLYHKPSLNAVKKQFSKIRNQIPCKSCSQSPILHYYTFDISLSAKRKNDRWSLEEALQSKDVLSLYYTKVMLYPGLFEGRGDSIVQKMRSVVCKFSNGIASFMSQFNLKSCLNILDSYFPDAFEHPGKYTWYDPSCGWGTRLLAGMSREINYVGTDPNTRLYPRLCSLAKDYASWLQEYDGLYPIKHSSVDIRNTGSEVFHPDLVNTVDLAFTSPPYFDLEDYSIGDQSFKPGMSLDAWFERYMCPTIDNCYQYIKPGGYLAINIKDTKDVKVMDRIRQYALSIGFLDDPAHSHLRIVNPRRNMRVDNSESIIALMKPGDPINPESLDAPSYSDLICQDIEPCSIS